MHVHFATHSGHATAVIAVAMREQQQIEVAQALAQEIRRDDGRASVEALVERGAGVVQERVMRRTQDHREPLPHIKRGHGQQGRRRAAAAGEQRHEADEA